MTPVRVVVADDQELIRAGLVAILDADDGVAVVGVADDGRRAAETVARTDADVVLMDVEMPGCDGVEGVSLVARARPQTRVLMLTMFDLDEYVFAALKAGASGFLLKTSPPEQLLAAIRGVYAGEMLFAPSVTRRLVDTYVRRTPRSAEGAPAELAGLTERELDVFRALARGLTNAEIGRELYLGEATVKTHITRILAKLGLRDRVQAVVLAYECGLAGS